MTDDLKHKLDQLVADPPPPTTVPSQAVFARVRTARRRRTAGVATLATAAVVAVTVAAGNLTDINSAPPITNTPTAPATTSSPTATPTTTPVTRTPQKTTGSSTVTGAAHSPASHNTPPPSSQHTEKTPQIPPLGVHVGLRPVVNGRTVTMRVTVSGTELVPTDGINNRPLKDEDHSFFNMLGGTQYEFGDGGESGSDAGAVRCDRTTKYLTGRETYSAETHTYAKPGTYTFHYRVNYCGKTGWVPATKTTTVTVK